LQRGRQLRGFYGKAQDKPISVAIGSEKPACVDSDKRGSPPPSGQKGRRGLFFGGPTKQSAPVLFSDTVARIA
jgi:hypothetical protein